MANPPITSNTVGRNPVTTQGAPTPMGAPGASWLGRSPMTTVAYPQVPGLMWQGKAQGRFSLIESVPAQDVRFARGPRMVPQRGTIDVWVQAPAAGSARSAVLLGEAAPTFANSHFHIGINDANFVTAHVRDKSGTLVVNILADAIAALPVGRLSHIVLTWDALLGTSTLTVNNVPTPGGDFAVNPSGTPWVPAVPVEVDLSKGSWGPTGSINLVQISSQVI